MAVAAAPADTRREVADQVGRIANLTRDLLDYAKPWKLNLAPVDLAELVRSAAQRHREVALGLGLMPGDSPPPKLQADARRIEQALTNLFENANTAVESQDALPVAGVGTGSPPNHVPAQVHLDLEISASAVLLHVCDSGPGVPPEIRGRLFEPFASRSPGGTGLGLAIVARIMVAHGGSVALTVRAPWATCFTLSFPLNVPLNP